METVPLLFADGTAALLAPRSPCDLAPLRQVADSQTEELDGALQAVVIVTLVNCWERASAGLGRWCQPLAVRSGQAALLEGALEVLVRSVVSRQRSVAPSINRYLWLPICCPPTSLESTGHVRHTSPTVVSPRRAVSPRSL